MFDFDIYVRKTVNSQRVAYMVAALEAGGEFPPVVIDIKSKRIVDGFHRVRSHTRYYGDDYEIDCVEKRYKNDEEMFLDSVRLNAKHGLAMDKADRTRCLILAEKFKISVADIAVAMEMTVEAVTELKQIRVADVKVNTWKQPVALKRTIQHMAGKTLTQKQVEANRHLSGMRPVFYANQLITLIENELLPTDDEKLMQRLSYLGTLIRKLKVPS